MVVSLIAVLATVGSIPVTAGEKNLQICHLPPGNDASFLTISVSPNALPGHLKHGDIEKACDQACDIICDDGDPTTIDSCSADFACTHTPVGPPCPCFGSGDLAKLPQPTTLVFDVTDTGPRLGVLSRCSSQVSSNNEFTIWWTENDVPAPAPGCSTLFTKPGEPSEWMFIPSDDEGELLSCEAIMTAECGL